MRLFYQHTIWTACALYTIHLIITKLTPVKKRDPAGDRPKFTREKRWSLMFTPQAKKNTCLFWGNNGNWRVTDAGWRGKQASIQGAAQPYD